MSYADDVRRFYLHDPLCSDEHYGRLMEQAHEADRVAEDEAELLSSLDTEPEPVYPGVCPFCGMYTHSRYCPDLED